MKLLSTLCGLGSVANALSEVHVVGQVASDVAKITACNDANNRIAINVSVNGDYLAAADGWVEDGSNWTREFALDELENLGVIDNQLVMGKTIDLNYNLDFFLDGDYTLSFKCYYSVEDQIVDINSSTKISSFGVQAQNQHHVIATGSLNYNFVMDRSTQEIGETIEFSVEPLNPGVIYNRVTECVVTNGSENYYIFGGETPFCADEFTEFKAVSGWGSTGVQRFSYTAFKWGETSNGVDSHNIRCKVEFNSRPFVEIDINKCDGIIPTTSTSSTTAPTARTSGPAISTAIPTSTPLPIFTTQSTTSTTTLMHKNAPLWQMADIDCETDTRWNAIMCPKKAARQKRIKDRRAIKAQRAAERQAAQDLMQQLKEERDQLVIDIEAQLEG